MGQATLSYAVDVPPPPRKVGRLTWLAVAVSVLACPFLLGAIVERLPASLGLRDRLESLGLPIFIAAAVISLGLTLIAAGRSDFHRERTSADSILIVIAFVLSFSWVFILGYVWWFIQRP